ncbi:MAG TPA: putative porin [Chitinophagaceae bacterium]|nr:putative porin [Chitinophagaceae bacterium]
MLIFCWGEAVLAQDDPIMRIGGRMQQMGGMGRRTGGSGGTDSLRQRNKNEDSITISFRYLDSTGTYKLDSSIGDFTRRFPIPATHIFLGNLGNASRSLLFSPVMKAGFTPGFNAFDIYMWKMQQVRFFNTTRPYSELNYQIGSRVEQMIDLLHTQNLKPNWNIALQYRLINAPGFFKNQKTNHNNYLLSSFFQSGNKRYSNYFVLLGNKMQSAENGGIKDNKDFLNDPIYKDRFNIQTKIGGDDPFSSNFFTTKISTGNKYNEFSALLRQQYDFGKKDSLVTDSTVVPLFFPRLRLEHNFRLDQNKYIFQDFLADSVYYKTYYDTALRSPLDTFLVRESWKIITNDFSIYQYPDIKNLKQFIKMGVTVQNFTGEFYRGKNNFYNLSGHAEYRNKTRNQKWEIEANGRLYFTGLNSGDYEAFVSLQGFAGKKLGYVQLGFENVSRTPSFFYDSRSSFYLMKTVQDFKKENTTHLFASYFLPSFKFRLTGHYYLLTNYTYLEDFYLLKQESTLFNVFQLSLQKTVRIGKKWNWHAEVYFQQKIGDGPVNLPVIYTRNRIAYEGDLGFKNLDFAGGLEVRYRAAYKADGYSPVLGKFFFQDNVTIRNELPDISAYVHFRIKPFKAFIRFENLNTARNLDGFSFTRNNLVAPGYALPGLQIRTGVYWSFVN